MLRFVDRVREDLSLESMASVVKMAIFPFQPTKITAYVSEHMARGRRLEIEVGNIPTHHFRMDITDLMMTAREEEIADVVYRRLFHHYRDRPYLPPDDHIILGQD